jgi:hypothetical protein
MDLDKIHLAGTPRMLPKLQVETVKAFVRAAEAARRIAARAIVIAERDAELNDEQSSEEN